MLDQLRLYELIYALASMGGRQEALFGDSVRASYAAFTHSLAGDAFPELWFELPLAGTPWFDLHALTSRASLKPGMEFSPETTGGHPKAFEWFAAQDTGTRQLALSWDTGSGDATHPAIQLLVSTRNPEITCGFLQAAGKPMAVPSYRTFIKHIPKNWFACYAGVFPSRPGHNLRVECIPSRDLQDVYAQDADLLAAHLQQVGLRELGDTLIERCQILARAPFRIEFQFDVDAEGSASHTFAASVRFSEPPGTATWQAFDPQAAAGELMARIEDWGLTDQRWHHLAGTMFSKRIKRNEESHLLYCLPTFVKLRWREGEPLDAKAYLIAGVGESTGQRS